MPDAVIVSACRTAIGTAWKGTLADTSAFDLARHILQSSIGRSGISPEEFDDVVLAESMYGGGVIARHAAVECGLLDVPGLADNRHCASGLSAVQIAASTIRAGMDRVVVAGGVQSSSTAPMSSWRIPGSDDVVERWMSPSHPNRPDAPNDDMSITVGWNTAQRAGLSREQMDEWALRSHERAVAAIDDGRFTEEIVPIEARRRDGSTTTFEVDEHPRRDTSMERLASLKPLHPEIDGFSVTAGNASGVNDAASALVLTSDTFAADHGLHSLGTVRSWASVGVDPFDTGLSPTKAIPKALDRAGLRVQDVDLFEINEAFASVPVAACQILDIDPAIVNVVGSGCSLGHPIAATGARMVTTLVYELRRRGGGIAVASMCAGGGMGSAAVIEVPGN